MSLKGWWMKTEIYHEESVENTLAIDRGTRK